MSLYLKQIELLVLLQKVDDDIHKLQKELDEMPKELTDLETQAQEDADKTKQIDERIDYLENQKKRLEAEIEEDAHKIKKSKSKLMMVGNSREYHAMMRELDNMEKINRLREEEKVTLSEELAKLAEEREGVAEHSKETQGVLDERKKSLESRMQKAQKQLSDLEKQRAAACDCVPKPIMGRYDFIRMRMEHPVIVSVEAGVCKGCNISIPPQSFIELQKGQQILSCPNCQRLIFWCEHFHQAMEKDQETIKEEAKEEA